MLVGEGKGVSAGVGGWGLDRRGGRGLDYWSRGGRYGRRG